MSEYVKNQNTQKDMQKRIQNNGALRNNNYMRPSSANSKRKDGVPGGPNDNAGIIDMNQNMRQFIA
jgi:hypothetical protein